MDRNTEYEALRAEILQWQARRITLFGGSLVTTTAFIGWLIAGRESMPWAAALSLLYFLQACVCGLLWVMARDNTKIGSYLQVFHEEANEVQGWESRSRKAEKILSEQSSSRMGWGVEINPILGLIQLGLAGLAFVVATAGKSQGQLLSVDLVTVVMSAFFLAWTVSLLVFRSYPRSEYLKHWHAVREEEESSSDVT